MRYHNRPFELLSSDAVEGIHQAALSILQETGMAILSDEACQRYATAGFDIDSDSNRVRFVSDLVESLVSQAPSSFTLQARNPARNMSRTKPNTRLPMVQPPTVAIARTSDIPRS